MNENSVILPHAVIDSLESILSPVDEIAVIEQIDAQLPRCHKPRQSRFSWLGTASLPLYYGNIESLLLEFTYAVYDGRFHVLAFRELSRQEKERRSFDCRISILESIDA